MTSIKTLLKNKDNLPTFEQLLDHEDFEFELEKCFDLKKYLATEEILKQIFSYSFDKTKEELNDEKISKYHKLCILILEKNIYKIKPILSNLIELVLE